MAIVRKNEVLRHIPELDGVRGIAILIVMIMHFYDPVQSARPFAPLDRVMEHGTAGVDLFFVLSGFLITSILTGTRSATNYFRSFYARRALRIFPLYMLVVAVFFFAVVPLSQHHGKLIWIRPTEQIWYWLFLANWRHAFAYNDGAQLAHFWSLAIEEQFYLLWSVLAWLLTPRHLKHLAIFLVVVAMLGRTLGAWYGLSHLLLVNATFFRIDALGLGALLALSPKFSSWMSRFAVVILSATVFLLFLHLPYESAITLYDIGSTALVAVAVNRSVPALRWDFLRSFGKYSYGLYVLHYLLHGALAPLAPRFNPKIFVCGSIVGGIAISYAAAWVSWWVLESPFLRLKRSVPYQFPAAASH